MSGNPLARLTVSGIRARAVSIPLHRAIQTAGGTVWVSPVLLLDLVTEEGITGHAYLFCYTPAVLAPLVRLVTEVAPLVQGCDASPAALQTRLNAHFRLLGAKGLIGMLIAGIDMATWDAAGKASDLPLSRLLGGGRDEIPAYAGIRSMSPTDAACEADEAVRAGFEAVKVKLGHPSLADDLALIRAVRSAVGDDVEVMADYNQSLTPTEALRRGRALEAESIAWIEEPLGADDDAGHAALARALQIPIQLGENWWGASEAARAIGAGATDYVTFDVARIGGVTGWLAASTLAVEAKLPVSSHRYPELSASLLAVTPTAHWLEYVDTVSPVLADPVVVRKGRVIAPDAPGTGVTWDEEAVTRFLVQ